MPAIAEKYVANKNATLTLDSVSLVILGGTIKFDQKVDDFTSNVSEGHGEDIATIDRWTLDIEVAYNGDAPPTWVHGAKYNFVYGAGNATYVADNGMYLSGVARVGSVSYNAPDIKAGLKMSMTLTSQGAVTTVRP
jgi:hypothetical protein